MKLLFYIEPLSFHNDLCHYWKWLERMVHIQTTLFVGRKTDWDYRFVMNEGLFWQACEKHKVNEGKVISLQQNEIREIFNCSNMDIIKKIHHKSLLQTEKDQLSKLYSGKLNGYKPDVILTYSPASFFEEIFSDVLVFHMENGPFSRHPFPETTYFDPQGLYQQSFIEKCATDLMNMSATQEDKKFLDDLREPYKNLIIQKSPFHYLENVLRKTYRKLVLVPLQTSHTMYYDLCGPFNTQGEFLFDLIEKTPKDTALILSFHNIALYFNDLLREGTLEYLSKKHPNVIILDHVLDVCASSQFLLHHVDAMVSISSSVTWQAMLWGVPTINIGSSHLRHFCTHESWDKFLENEDKIVCHEGALSWMFRHYFPTAEYALYNSRWLEELLQHSLDKKRGADMSLSFFKPIDSDENLIANLYSEKQQANRKKIPAFERGFQQIVGAVSEIAFNDKKNLIINGDFSYPISAIDNIDPFLVCPRWNLIGNIHDKLKIKVKTLDKSSDYPESNLKNALYISAQQNFEECFMLIHKISDVENLIGKKVKITFWSRGSSGAAFAIRQYFQFPSQPHFNVGNNPSFVMPTEAWTYFEHEIQLPCKPSGSTIQPNCFMEFVIELPKIYKDTYIEITGLALELVTHEQCSKVKSEVQEVVEGA